jgi:hypothetical protein
MQVKRMVDSSNTWRSEIQDPVSLSRSECIPNSMTLRTEGVGLSGNASDLRYRGS